MKIGVLIIAHNQPDYLKDLVNFLKNDFSIFIHLDKRSEIPETIFKDETNIHVIKKHKVYWGSFNLVLVTYDLLKLAYENQCDYYLVISGCDFPIKKNREIISEIERAPDISYVDHLPLPRKDWLLNGGFDRLHLWWEIVKNPNSSSLFNRLCALGRMIQRLLHIKRKLLPLTYYGGSNWINLSKEAVEYMLHYIEEHPEFFRSFHYTRVGDEIWVQTLLLNSPLREKIISNSKRYIDWTSGPEYPRILRISDFDKIMQSNAFFARKFDLKIDKKIYEEILNVYNL